MAWSGCGPWIHRDAVTIGNPAACSLAMVTGFISQTIHVVTFTQGATGNEVKRTMTQQTISTCKVPVVCLEYKHLGTE